MRAILFALVAATALSYSCASAPPLPSAPPAATQTSTASATPPSPPSAPPAPPPPTLPASPPETPAHKQLTWVVDSMAHTPNQGDIVAHFSPTFIANVPPATVVTVFKQVVKGAPFTLATVTPAPDNAANALKATVQSAAGPAFDIDLVVDGSGLLQGLLIKPKSAH
jgi:ORF 12 gene product N-terminal